MAWEPQPGDYVRPVGLVKAAALNGALGLVQDQSRWGEGRVAVLLDTTPPKGYQLKRKNLEELYFIFEQRIGQLQRVSH